MKRFLRIFLISLGSLLGLAVILTGVVMWLIFTPSRLTPMIERQLPRFIDCPAEVERVELTFFRTFPRFGIQADGLTLINPTEGAQSDTLLHVRQFRGAVDIRALLRRNELVLRDIVLVDGRANAYIGPDGRTNFDIFPTAGAAEESPSDTVSLSDTDSTDGFGHIDADCLRINGMDISYFDAATGIKACVKGLSGRVKGSFSDALPDAKMAVDVNLEPMDIAFEYTDAGSDVPAMSAELSQLSLKIIAAMADGLLKTDVRMLPTVASLQYGGEDYLHETMIDIAILGSVDTAQRTAMIDDIALSVNGLRLNASGSAALIPATAASHSAPGTAHSAADAKNTSIPGFVTDLAYKFDRWPVKDLMALVPPSMTKYFDGIDAEGLLSLAGTVRGEYRDPHTMPLIDANVVIENASVTYPEMLPFPLSGLHGDINIYTDLADDELSYVRINNFRAKTPKSSLSAVGLVKRLFSDPHADLDMDADLDIAELAPMLPEDMDARMKGRVAGSIEVDATLSQLTEMELDKMKVSGLLAMNDIDVVYDDSLAVRADRMMLDFSLPNRAAGRRATSFAAVRLAADNLAAGMTGSFDASMRNVVVELETSDVRDTAVFPAMICRFGFDALSAATDSVSVVIEKPSGSVSLSTSRRRADRPKFDVALNSGRLLGTMNGERVSVERMNIRAGVTYDEMQEDLLLKWLPRGSIEIENGYAETSVLRYPVRIPAVEMDFTPREFNIGRAGVVIDNTDFNLSGTLTDILPYLRGEATLKGDFDFTSSMTDIAMLMDLTSGLGSDEGDSATVPTSAVCTSADISADIPVATQAATQVSPPVDSLTDPAIVVPANPEPGRSSHPYMVPKGMDLALHTDIRQALWQGDTLRDIRGDVRVKDGQLVLDDIAFSSPATDMRLTAMYRTERENHLFVGMNLSMLNVEIPALLQMVPDLETLMPMLSSFGGQGEFRVVAETYLDSTYTLKMSTLRGAASIRGNDLVLMDGETFSEIAKMLRFNKKTENKVDSLAAEFTIFRNQIDVYPFLLVMDKYKVVVGGRHDTNMSFDYNISLVESPLPVRLSLNVYGRLDDLHFRLIKNPYKGFYRPASRQVVEGQQLQLRNLIRNSMLKPDDEDTPAADGI